MLSHIDDYVCCRSTILENLEKKFGKPVNISSIESAEIVSGDGLKKFTFNIGKRDENGGNKLHITTTEEGLMFKLLELSVKRKTVCKYCENNMKDSCIQMQLELELVRKEEFSHKLDKELCFA